ncbi:MAG: 50S ribosomal protein L5 [Patescibacteria group bacterium]|nr:MAG: 50S ribosomal protein L5 [Patescibacteria group bacterium]
MRISSMTGLKQLYTDKLREELKQELKLDNIFRVPVIEKIVVNVGVGEAVTNKNALTAVSEQITKITGQKPIITKAKKAEAGFKIRKGFPVGVKVTLRNKRMYDFLEKLVKIVIPRVKDFRGIRLNSVDSNGNLNLGFTEQLIFPELDFDSIDKIRGLQVTVVVRSEKRDWAIELYKKLGFKFSE